VCDESSDSFTFSYCTMRYCIHQRWRRLLITLSPSNTYKEYLLTISLCNQRNIQLRRQMILAAVNCCKMQDSKLNRNKYTRNNTLLSWNFTLQHYAIAGLHSKSTTDMDIQWNKIHRLLTQSTLDWGYNHNGSTGQKHVHLTQSIHHDNGKEMKC